MLLDLRRLKDRRARKGHQWSGHTADTIATGTEVAPETARMVCECVGAT